MNLPINKASVMECFLPSIYLLFISNKISSAYQSCFIELSESPLLPKRSIITMRVPWNVSDKDVDM